jgi:hypothetical protein
MDTGFYKVGNNFFKNKVSAIMHANNNKEDVTWHFHDEVFNSVDWTTEPELSLDNLYSLRAKQIREKFDYIVLMCSGGADSTNMLNAFINNNLRIDEIIIAAPISGLSNWEWNANDTSVNNMISETKFAQFPLIHRIKTNYPNIKITLHDYFEDILTLTPDQWMENLSNWFHPSVTRHKLDKFAHLKNIAESGKMLGIVYGVDKPQVAISKKRDFYFVIHDQTADIFQGHFKEDYINVETVLFYYTADLPSLIVKQVHEILKWIHKPENLFVKDFIVDELKSVEFNKSNKRITKYQRSIVPCIYPSLTNFEETFQADKCTVGIEGGNQLDAWFYKLHPSLQQVQIIESDVNSLFNFFDAKYRDQFDGGILKFRKYWKIGPESKFLNVTI